MSTSRPLPPGRRGRGARASVGATRPLPEPRLLCAPSAPAFPAKGPSKPVESEQMQPPPHAWPSAPSWGQRAASPAAVAALSARLSPPAATYAAAAAPQAQASGFQAARAMFDANKSVASHPTPPQHVTPSRFGARPSSIATLSSDAPGAFAAPKAPAPAPDLSPERAPSSVKALISRLNSPAVVPTPVTPPTARQSANLRFRGAISAATVESPPPAQRAVLATAAATPTATTKRALTPKPAAGVESVAPAVPFLTTRPAVSHVLAQASSTPPAPVSTTNVRPTQLPPSPVATPAPSPSVEAPPTLNPPPMADPTAPVATTAAVEVSEFHPFNLLLPVTAVPSIPRRMDCVYDEAAAEMQRNVMKVVKKLFRKTKPRVEDFKVNAKLFGNGFMDAEDYLAALIKDFRALRALQLVPCLVSIQPDATKRENLLYAARGYRLRNLDQLQSQCDLPLSASTPEQRPRLPSSDSVASTVSTVSTVSIAVDQAAPSDAEHTKKQATASEPLVKLVEPSATEHGAHKSGKLDSSMATTTEPVEPEPVSEPLPLASKSRELVAKLQPMKDACDQDTRAACKDEVAVSAPADTVPIATEWSSSTAKQGGAKAEHALSEADTDSDSSTTDGATPLSMEVSTRIEGRSIDQGRPSQPMQHQAATSTADEAVPLADSKPESEPQVEVLPPVTKPISGAVAVPEPVRADSFSSSDNEQEDAIASSSLNMFGEVVGPKKHHPEQLSVDSDKHATTPVTSARPAGNEAEGLFGGSLEPVVAIQALGSPGVDTTDAFSLFGPSSASSSPARSPTSSDSAAGSATKPRKSVTWGGTQAKEIPARRSSPSPAPMIFGFATACAYSDSDSDSDTDFE